VTLFKPKPITSFNGKDLPTSLWESDILLLPQQLSNAHRDHLEKNNWMEAYVSGEKLAGVIGGASDEEANQHFVERFLNSAARVQYVCADPKGHNTEIKNMVLDQLADGHLFLLDIAAGNGAGALAILSLLCELRASKCIPKLPVNVSIAGVDYSAAALMLYQDMLSAITPWLENHGIEVSLELHVCDLRVSGEFNEVLELFFDDAKESGVSRFLCLISAVSGIGKEGLEEIHDSLKIAAARLSHKQRNSSWLWIEPSSKSWTSFATSIGLILKKIPHLFNKKRDSYEIKSSVPLSKDPISQKFSWLVPHKNKNVTSHVIIMAFKDD
jgi:hypothetical protein